MSTQRSAVITGASSGIGAATVEALTGRGWQVFALARRAQRLERLAEKTGAIPVPTDTSDHDAVQAALATVSAAGGIDTLINIAGMAQGMDQIAESKAVDWEEMFRVNVLGTMLMTRAFIPMLRAHGQGTILNVTSTAALVSYEGGGGYNAAKSAERAMTQALRLEEAEHNVRVIEVLPGMVQTEEFSLNRLGSNEAAEVVYRGVEQPLVADDIADIIAYAVTAPHHVNLDEIVVRPVAQAAQHKVIRVGKS